MKRLWARVCAGAMLCLCMASPAQAILTIEITQGVEGAMPVAVVPFEWKGEEGTQPPEDVAAIITADLQRSGRFAPLPVDDMLSQPHEGSEVNYHDWRLLNVDSLVVGRVIPSGENYIVQFQLFDIFRASPQIGYSIRSTAGGMRLTAHQISDLIYESLMGEPGAFATRIAYVTEIRHDDGSRHYSLQVADADGHNPQPVLNSTQPLMSPSWSPDGKQMALVLSRQGNADIYILDMEKRNLRQITQNYAIDTEPVWYPDSSALIFTSDRGGTPQLYRVYLADGKATRLTFEGSYNTRASISPDGKRIAFVHGDQGSFRIAVMELDGGALQVLTDSTLDESPSFAPNGSMIIYATEAKGKGVLSAVSVDGRVKQRLALQIGDAREPAWSPYTGKQ